MMIEIQGHEYINPAHIVKVSRIRYYNGLDWTFDMELITKEMVTSKSSPTKEDAEEYRQALVSGAAV